MSPHALRPSSNVNVRVLRIECGRCRYQASVIVADGSILSGQRGEGDKLSRRERASVKEDSKAGTRVSKVAVRDVARQRTASTHETMSKTPGSHADNGGLAWKRRDDSRIQGSRFNENYSGGVFAAELKQGKAAGDAYQSPTTGRNRFDSGKLDNKEAAQHNASPALEFGAPSHVNTITSASNQFIKMVAQLRRSVVFRGSLQRSVLVGLSPIRELCTHFHSQADHDTLTQPQSIQPGSTPAFEPSASFPLEYLLLPEGSPQPDALLSRSAQRIIYLSEAAFLRASGIETFDPTRAAAAVVLFPPAYTDLTARDWRGAGAGKERRNVLRKWAAGGTHILALEAVQDPGNVGTLIRTAAAFAWDGVFLLPGCCDPFNDKALRAGRGAAFRLPIAVGEWDDLRQLARDRGLRLLAADPDKPCQPDVLADLNGLSFTAPAQEEGRQASAVARSGRWDSVARSNKEGENASEIPGTQCAKNAGEDDGKESNMNWSEDRPFQGTCIVLGSEGQGLSDVALQACAPVSIPMPGDMESLNVAVAGGILLYALRRQC